MSAAEPILVPISDSKAVDNLNYLEVQPVVKYIVKHSFNQGGNLGFSSSKKEEVMAPKQRVLGKKKATEDEVVKLTPNLVLALMSQAEDQSVRSPSRSGKGKGSNKWIGLPIKRRGRVSVTHLAFSSSGLQRLRLPTPPKIMRLVWPWGMLLCSRKTLRTLLRKIHRGLEVG